MKTKLSSAIILLLVFLICSCKEITRKNALQNERETELNGIIEYFARCNYCLPQNINEILSFINEWKKKAPQEYPYSDNITDPLYTRRIQFANYRDSVFLYDKQDKLGCSVKGTPYYWLKHPDTYPIERMDFSEIFRVSAFSKNNEFIFEIDYDIFENIMEGINADYRRKYLFKKKNDSLGIEQFFPLFAIVKIDLENGRTTILYQNSSTIYSCLELSPHDIEEYKGDIKADTEDYLNDIIETTKSYFCTMGTIHKVVVPVRLRSKYSS